MVAKIHIHFFARLFGVFFQEKLVVLFGLFYTVYNQFVIIQLYRKIIFVFNEACF